MWSISLCNFIKRLFWLSIAIFVAGESLNAPISVFHMTHASVFVRRSFVCVCKFTQQSLFWHLFCSRGFSTKRHRFNSVCIIGCIHILRCCSKAKNRPKKRRRKKDTLIRKLKSIALEHTFIAFEIYHFRFPVILFPFRSFEAILLVSNNCVTSDTSKWRAQAMDILKKMFGLNGGAAATEKDAAISDKNAKRWAIVFKNYSNILYWNISVRARASGWVTCIKTAVYCVRAMFGESLVKNR